jgi:hypothetical protein
MRKILFFVSALSTLSPATAFAQDDTRLQRAAAVQVNTCTVRAERDAQGRPRVVATCPTREATEEAKRQFREAVGASRTFGPTCSYTVSTPPVLRSCSAFAE